MNQRRLVFIGDIHGCYEELVELLEEVAPSPGDLVVSVGDILRKGPSPAKCVDLWRQRGYLAVLGNQDRFVLIRSFWPARMVLGAGDREFVRSGDRIDHVRRWPLALDFPAERVAVVHAGVMPDFRFDDGIESLTPDVALSLRYLRRTGPGWRKIDKVERRTGDPFWADVWDGDRFIVYGHTPAAEPRWSSKALGIDTGCVYGGVLTAAILEEGEWTTVSVRARRRYASRS